MILSRRQLTKDRWLIATPERVLPVGFRYTALISFSLFFCQSLSLVHAGVCGEFVMFGTRRKTSVWQVSWCTAALCQRTLRSAFRSVAKLTPVCRIATAWSWFWLLPVNTSNSSATLSDPCMNLARYDVRWSSDLFRWCVLVLGNMLHSHIVLSSYPLRSPITWCYHANFFNYLLSFVAKSEPSPGYS